MPNDPRLLARKGWAEIQLSRFDSAITNFSRVLSVAPADEQARLLARHAKRLSAKVNLTPYNTVHGLPWTRPSQDRQEAFLSTLRERGVAATLRREKGHDIDAACGQLRLQTKREMSTASS